MLLASWRLSAEIPATADQVFLKSPLNMFMFSKQREQQRSEAAHRPHLGTAELPPHRLHPSGSCQELDGCLRNKFHMGRFSDGEV